MQTIIDIIDRTIAAVGNVVRYFVLGIIALVVIEVLNRALFNTSFTWTREIAQWLGAAIILIGGAHALIDNKFVRVDVIYGAMPPKLRALVDLILGTACFVLVAYVLIQFGGKFAMASINRLETSNASWGGPVWTAKALLPISGVLLSLGWLLISLKNIQILTGERTDNINSEPGGL